jgi:hypothetical protein
MTSDEAADLLRRHITERATDQIAATLTTPDARLRAALVGAMMMGIAAERYVLRMPDLADADLDQIITLVAPLLRDLLTAD